MKVNINRLLVIRRWRFIIGGIVFIRHGTPVDRLASLNAFYIVVPQFHRDQTKELIKFGYEHFMPPVKR